MTLGEASICFALFCSVIAFLYKAIRENTNADSFRKILNKLAVVQEIHATKFRNIEDAHGALKKRVENHDDDFRNVRESIRDLSKQT